MLCDRTSNFKDFTKFGSEIHEVDTWHFKLLFIKFLCAFLDQNYVLSFFMEKTGDLLIFAQSIYIYVVDF